MKKTLQIFLFLVAHTVFAQIDYSNSWVDFYSYNNVKDFIQVDQKIYAIVDNAIFTYNTVSKETIKLSSVNGLSGEKTSSIFYSKTFDKVVVGYESGLIEIIDNKGNITVVKDIVSFNYTGVKQINDISEYGNKLYLSTPFAIIVYNLESLQFGDTYFIGNQSSEVYIYKTAILNDSIYAATENGVFKADLTNPNLIDFNNWTQLFVGNFNEIAIFNGSVYTSNNRNLYKIENSVLTLQKTFAQPVKSIKVSSNYLTLATQRSVYVYDVSFGEIVNFTSQTSDAFYFNLNTAYFNNNQLYLGTLEYGILNSSNDNIALFNEIHPDGPNSNLPFSIAVKNKHLWVVYGAYDLAYTPLRKRFGYSHFNGDMWVNTPYNTTYNVHDFVNITFDPIIENKVYLSSWGDGMAIVEDDVITTYWNHLNSGLEKLDFPNPSYISIRINGAAFDTQNNLWIANAWVDNRIKKYSSNGNWSSFDMSSVMTNPALGLNELVIDKSNSIWIGSRRNGVLVFNENSNKKTALNTDPNSGDLPDLNARSVKVDQSNRVWIGTKSGLVVYQNASQIFNESIFQAKPIIILDDGIPKKLLGNQAINSIAIDGADNKWFGTESGGAIQTNPNGTKILNSFNKNNSPLPSNTILKIAIDNASGIVYFATDSGIVSFDSNVAPYGENLAEVYAYPNPSTKQNEFITIDGMNGGHLPKGTNVKIVDTAGNLVFETNIKEGQQLSGGKVIWNKTNLAGHKVASGVYIVLLVTEDNLETSVAKIAIIN